jgi:hypothetical protein
MVKIIGTNQPIEGYVLEAENYSQVSLIQYTRKGNQYVPSEPLCICTDDDLVRVKNERQLRKLLGKVHSSKTIYCRDELKSLLPKKLRNE